MMHQIDLVACLVGYLSAQNIEFSRNSSRTSQQETYRLGHQRRSKSKQSTSPSETFASKIVPIISIRNNIDTILVNSATTTVNHLQT